MKILTVCDQGNNRSVHLAHLLKYWNNDVLPVGLDTNSKETLEMLYKWADAIIVVEDAMRQVIPIEFIQKVKVWNVGEDVYSRPFNTQLHQKAKQYLEENKGWLKND